MSRQDMTDRELDNILSLATTPKPMAGATSRVMERIAASGGQASTGTVIAFPVRNKPAVFARPWIAAVPLAASLAAGIWLGALGTGSDLMLGVTDDARITEAQSGLEDVEILAEDDLS